MDVDELLRSAGRRWRDTEGSPPRYDVPSIVRSADDRRRRTSWLAGSAAAAALVLVVVGVVVRVHSPSTGSASAGAPCAPAQLGSALERVDSHGWTLRIGNVSQQTCSIGRGPRSARFDSAAVRLTPATGGAVALRPGGAVELTVTLSGDHSCPARLGAREPGSLVVRTDGGATLEVTVPGALDPRVECSYGAVAPAAWSAVPHPVPLCRADQLSAEWALNPGPMVLQVRNRGARCDLGIGPRVPRSPGLVAVASEPTGGTPAAVVLPGGASVAIGFWPGLRCPAPGAGPDSRTPVAGVGVPSGTLVPDWVIWQPSSGGRQFACLQSDLLWTRR